MVLIVGSLLLWSCGVLVWVRLLGVRLVGRIRFLCRIDGRRRGVVLVEFSCVAVCVGGRFGLLSVGRLVVDCWVSLLVELEHLLGSQSFRGLVGQGGKLRAWYLLGLHPVSLLGKASGRVF